MNVAKAEKTAREFLRDDFVQNKGLTINGTFFKDLETFRRKDPIAYRALIDALVWSPMDYDRAVHPEKLVRI